ncbi:MAG: fumarylacetoacetate hydrolase family protein [Gammaproteobacteria bacterium]|jgi:2-keto-4-pentenoate hydratase/2-oxohepta-3-ene-1,7-dioic acid hydratase in catechol pathway|nr:fumarylacetoacetate hydrolase family protein [Gammaproteobacteria bacterium]MBP6479241.1 fumarylacetoacetate hydrolase family protein [Pseudomonadales bacterium]MBP7909241.1 fumarylacetoacetate hydrolase family protein [Pseudomonadales bacterium]
MKLIRFSRGDATPEFGVVVGDRALAFSSLQARSWRSRPALHDSRSYLAALPESEQAARELLAWAEAHPEALPEGERPLLASVKLHAPVEVAALYDFGLTPRHLANSADTMARHEKDNPQTSALIEAFRQMLQKPPVATPPGQAERLSYYKCNMNSVSGDGASIPWPRYTSRLDIEPELAFVYGNARQPIAGYCIFNDVSARDVQAPEIIGGFCLTKDMAQGNQLGPWLVTPDEVGDPRALEVNVTVDGSERYRGSTAEISHTAQDVIRWLETICPLAPGSVIGMGTIPDCTGLDHDDFIDPGAAIAISFSRLGTLRCRFAEPQGRLLPSRWPLRPALERYHRPITPPAATAAASCRSSP